MPTMITNEGNDESGNNGDDETIQNTDTDKVDDGSEKTSSDSGSSSSSNNDESSSDESNVSKESSATTPKSGTGKTINTSKRKQNSRTNSDTTEVYNPKRSKSNSNELPGAPNDNEPESNDSDDAEDTCFEPPERNDLVINSDWRYYLDPCNETKSSAHDNINYQELTYIQNVDIENFVEKVDIEFTPKLVKFVEECLDDPGRRKCFGLLSDMKVSSRLLKDITEPKIDREGLLKLANYKGTAQGKMKKSHHAVSLGYQKGAMNKQLKEMCIAFLTYNVDGKFDSRSHQTLSDIKGVLASNKSSSVFLFANHSVKINVMNKTRSCHMDNINNKPKKNSRLSIGSEFIKDHGVNPISLCVYTICDEYVIINYIATNIDFNGLGIARFLLHVVQCFLWNKHSYRNKSVNVKLMAYKDKWETYKMMGFMEIVNINDDENKELRQLLQFDKAYQTLYKCFSLNHLIPRGFDMQDFRQRSDFVRELRDLSKPFLDRALSLQKTAHEVNLLYDNASYKKIEYWHKIQFANLFGKTTGSDREVRYKNTLKKFLKDYNKASIKIGSLISTHLDNKRVLRNRKSSKSLLVMLRGLLLELANDLEEECRFRCNHCKKILGKFTLKGNKSISSKSLFLFMMRYEGHLMTHINHDGSEDRGCQGLDMSSKELIFHQWLKDYDYLSSLDLTKERDKKNSQIYYLMAQKIVWAWAHSFENLLDRYYSCQIRWMKMAKNELHQYLSDGPTTNERHGTDDQSRIRFGTADLIRGNEKYWENRMVKSKRPTAATLKKVQYEKDLKFMFKLFENISHIEYLDKELRNMEENPLPSCCDKEGNEDYYKDNNNIWIGHGKVNEREVSAFLHPEYVDPRFIGQRLVSACQNSPNQKHRISVEKRKELILDLELSFANVIIVKIKKIKPLERRRGKTYDILGIDKQNRLYDLDVQWIKDNFEEGSATWVQNFLSRAAIGQVWPLPDGSVKRMKDGTAFPTHGPIMKYEQGDLNACCVYSLASALSYIQDEDMSNYIYDHYEESMNFTEGTVMHYMAKLMRGSAANVDWVVMVNPNMKFYNTQKLKETDLTYDNLLTSVSDDLKLVRVSGLHVVTIWRDWIFDSNVPNALPLTKEWLQWCSSIESNNRDIVIEKGIGGYLFKTPVTIKKKMMKDG